MISGGDWSGSLVLLKYFYANHLCWLFFVAQDLLFLHSEFYINAEIVVDAVLRYGINHCEAYSRAESMAHYCGSQSTVHCVVAFTP